MILLSNWWRAETVFKFIWPSSAACHGHACKHWTQLKPIHFGMDADLNSAGELQPQRTVLDPGRQTV